MKDYRYNPFLNALEPIAITGETHVIPTNSPFTIRLAEVPLKESPSSVSLTIGGVAGVEVAADPAAGEFRCDYTTGADEDDNWNTGLIQFNSADAGKTVVVNYNGMGTLASTDFHGFQMFNTVGTFTFTVPKGVTTVYITGCGGGGGGGIFNGNSEVDGGGGGGGAGAIKNPLTVVSGQSYTITIGRGGVAGYFSSQTYYNGGSGGTTSFGALLSLAGGGGGSSQNGTGGTAGGNYASAGGNYVSYGGGNGGSSLFGTGGIGGCPSASIGKKGSGFGSGAGGSHSGTMAAASGNQGFILVEW